MAGDFFAAARYNGGLGRKGLSVLIGCLLWPGASMAGETANTAAASPASSSVKFDPGFLLAKGQVDVSRFARGNVVLPGRYRVDVVLNREWKASQDVTFQSVAGRDSAQPCLSMALLASYGVNIKQAAQGDADQPSGMQDEFCDGIERHIPDASMRFSSRTQTLSLSVPQLYMDHAARGYIDPAHWDRGIDAAVLSYNTSLSRTTGAYHSSQAYLGLRAGVNLGSWRLRQQGSYVWSSRRGSHYQNIAAYVQRDIPAMHAQLVLGDSFASGQITDGFRLRGLNLYTDARMYPQSQQGYAPVVRGVAQSNARVSIRQNGYLIQETIVSPGPFEISDLYPTSYGGDLEVSVTETDGRRSVFLVPYTALPQLLRSGRTMFSASLGQLQQAGDYHPWVMQGTWQHGFNNTYTGFGSFNAAQGYLQLGTGTALNTHYGAVALSFGASHATIPGGQPMQGYSLGATYSKQLTQTGTHFALGAYRFSSHGYLGVIDAARLRDRARGRLLTDPPARQRSRLDLNINQRIGKGQLFLSGSSTRYWGGGAMRLTSYALGYSASIKSLSWSLTAQRMRSETARYTTPAQQDNDAFDAVYYGAGYAGAHSTDNRIMLSLSLPLGESAHAPSFYSYLSRNTGAAPAKSIQIGVNGSAGRDDNITYSASADRNLGQADGKAFNADVGYQASYANLRLGVSRSGGANQVAMAAHGGVIVHAGGLSFSQQLGDTVALVEAPNAAGASIRSAIGVRVDRRGYAVVPNLTPYQRNTINLDAQDMRSDVELKESSRSVVPRLGAVVKLQYATASGRFLVVKAHRANGEPLPFAAAVLDRQGRVVGTVGQASKIFVRGAAERGALWVKWGETPDARCRIDYRLPAAKPNPSQAATGLLNARCVAPGEEEWPANENPSRA